MKNLLRSAWTATFPVFVGYLSVGFAFGLLFEKTGIPFYWALVMSLFVYAGSMQFVAISLLTVHATFLDIALMTFFVNFRHLFYGLSFIEAFSTMGKRKPYMIFSLTDETYSLLLGAKMPDGCDEKDYRFAIALMNQTYWILGTLLGGVIGSLIPFLPAGLDFIMTALFTVILVEQWLQTKKSLPIVIGAGSSLFVLFTFGPNEMIIPAMALIVSLLFVFKKQIATSGKGGQ